MSKKILIIEDNDSIRESVTEILEMANYEVIEAENGKIGVEQAQQHLPDIILCDIMMPELDGYGVLYMLSKSMQTSSIPFIFLTAKADHGDLRKGMEMGADDYLTKPFDDMELLNAIEVRLRKKAYQDLQNENKIAEFKTLISRMDGLKEFTKIIEGHKNREFRKNQVIYYDSDYGKGLFLVIEGTVKTIKVAEDGRELMTGMYKAGDYFGISAALSKSPYTDTASAVDDCKICMIPSEEMDKVLSMYPDVARKFIGILSHENREKEEQLLQIAYHSSRKKLAAAILRVYQRQLTKGNELTISRDDLASMACMATETVSRILSDFRDEKLIDRQGAAISILNFERLLNMKN